LHALNIDIICANSSPAKGRVERANRTLQDRLVKELRLAGAATLADDNALLPAFMADYNARFAKAPANSKDLHRGLGPGEDLEDSFAWKGERTLSRALTLQYDKILFILEPAEQAKPALAANRGRRSANGSPSSITPMAGLRSATTVSSWLTAPSTRFARSTRAPPPTTSGSDRS
jgi:hypothetical protein